MFTSLSFTGFVVGAAAVWRFTHLLVHEAGPAELLVRLRAVPGLQGTMSCFYCCSLWTALPLAAWAGQGWVEVAVLCLGLSGSAIVIDRLSAPRMPPPALWHEDAPAAAPAGQQPERKDPHVLLRA